MSRARATALALVNWKGVFYERYLLDPHVTALEGANGAGKTTVLIAAYVVLLPDLSRLRFTNVGETGATGGDRGLWGRLGELGRPSYAAMELSLPSGTTLVAGVCLERKAEPSLALTPFVVSDLPLEGRLRQILLVSDGQHDAVPELAEVRAAVATAGGRIEVFQSAKDYFGHLFELGVLPLRMATDEDRSKYAEMLRTSMTGGISRVLATELRSFLLKEETGLGDALSRMRSNLDACHRTRVEVTDAGRLEHEIRGVFDAGLAMVSASLLSARAAASESALRTQASREAFEQAQRTERAYEEELSDALSAHGACEVRLRAARSALDQSCASRDRVRVARACALRLAEIEAELAAAVEVSRAASAVKTEAAARRLARRHDCERAREAYDRAARGVADWQTGLEELHRSAHEHQRARRELARAREVLPELTESGLDAALESLRSRCRDLDLERAHADASDRAASIHREEYERARAALVEMAGDVQPGRDHERAREVLARASELEALAARARELGEESAFAQRLAERQLETRARATALGLDRCEPSAATAVEQRLALADAEVRAADEQAQRAEEQGVQHRAAADEVRRQRADLERAAERWAEASSLVARVEGLTGISVHSPEDLAKLRARVARDRDVSHARLYDLQHRRDERLRASDALTLQGPGAATDLSRLRDELDGEFLVARFEDVDAEQARLIEAELGPLVNALVVADPEAAARSLVGRPRDIDTVWLVAADERTHAGGQAATVRGDDIVVREAFGVRVARMPARSALGRRARAAQADALRAEAASLDQEIVQATEDLRSTEALSQDLARVPFDAVGLRSVDFAARRAELDVAETAAQDAGRVSGRQAQEARERSRSARVRVEAWRSLLSEALLLGPPDHGERAVALTRALDQALAADAEVRRVEAPRRALATLIDALRHAPSGEGEIEQREARRREHQQERARLFGAIEALEALVGLRRALGATGAEAALSERTGLLPQLESQLACARANLRSAEQELANEEAQWEAATAAAQVASAAVEAAAAQRTRVLADLDACGGRLASEAAYESAQAAVVGREEDRAALEQEERRRATQVALVRERRAQASAQASAAGAALQAAQQAAHPAAQRWAQMQARAEATGLFVLTRVASSADAEFGRTSVALESEVRSRAEVLVDRLGVARGGEECARAVRESLRSPGCSPCEVAVDVWTRVMDWLRVRLPAQVADVPQPLDALDRLRGDLGLLEERLARQESELRGASEDVARGIDVQLRRAAHQVKRLNRRLEGLAFGAVASIRVQLRRIERMEQVLGALREGAVQELLFDSSMPIEQALTEIFRRYGAGRTGGSARILDYREYIDLAVEIRRKAAGAWEPAHPTRLSTGEAIGVGAALMMVVLTEWEHDAKLLRSRRVDGALCLLFLDEANRLSQDNLGVLFELCKNLDLQLLIAAPEVARAEGNTTYRLVRCLGADGRDEVLVTGRRIRENVTD
ncbi:MAG: chromosome partition protein MukB [Polyangiaceae bacterium]|jgi:chromosome partition protein MukB